MCNEHVNYFYYFDGQLNNRDIVATKNALDCLDKTQRMYEQHNQETPADPVTIERISDAELKITMSDNHVMHWIVKRTDDKTIDFGDENNQTEILVFATRPALNDIATALEGRSFVPPSVAITMIDNLQHAWEKGNDQRPPALSVNRISKNHLHVVANNDLTIDWIINKTGKSNVDTSR